MVVVGIMVLLSGSGLTAYNQFNNRQKVKQAGAAVKDLLRLAQSKALTGEKPETGSCATTKLDGYQVRQEGGSLIMEAVCGRTPVAVGVSYQLPEEVSWAEGDKVEFKVLGQGASEERVCLAGYSWFYRIRILSSGEVVEDGMVDSCQAGLVSPTPLVVPEPGATATPVPEINSCAAYCVSKEFNSGECVKRKADCKDNDGKLKEAGYKYCTKPADKCCCYQ